MSWRGVLLDGHHRHEICLRHGAEFATAEVDLPDRDAAIEWIARNAMARRNLSPAQKIALAERVRPVLERRAADRRRAGLRGGTTPAPAEAAPVPQDLGERHEREVDAQVARLAGLSRETVRKYRGCRPYLHRRELERLDRGDLSVDRAHRIARDRRFEAMRAERRASQSPGKGSRYEVFEADVRGGLPEVGEASVDWVVTDPPYLRDCLPLYSDLGRLAARVLRPGGGCLVMCGQMYLPEILARLGEYLEYAWTLTYFTPSAHSQVWGRGVSSGWKPVVWYRHPGGDGVEPTRYDVVTGGRVSKELHHWQKPEDDMRSLMGPFVRPGEMVLDPFLGAGTTGVAALALGCQFVGCDLDPGTVAVAASRFAELPASAAA